MSGKSLNGFMGKTNIAFEIVKKTNRGVGSLIRPARIRVNFLMKQNKKGKDIFPFFA